MSEREGVGTGESHGPTNGFVFVCLLLNCRICHERFNTKSRYYHDGLIEVFSWPHPRAAQHGLDLSTGGGTSKQGTTVTAVESSRLVMYSSFHVLQNTSSAAERVCTFRAYAATLVQHVRFQNNATKCPAEKYRQ